MTIPVNMADFNIAKSPDILTTLGIGSCVAVCLYHRESKLGGLAHIMLPRNEKNNADFNGKFADTAIAGLLQLMLRNGARVSGISAKIAGGASVFVKGSEGTIGRNNVKAVKDILEQTGIRIIGEDTGGNHGRGLSFRTETGAVEVTVLTQPPKVICI